MGALELPPTPGWDTGTTRSSAVTRRAAAGLGVAPGLMALLPARPTASRNTYICRCVVVANTTRNPSCSHVYQQAVATP